MENLVCTTENILYYLRQNRSNTKDLQIIKLLEKVEKHGCENKAQQYKIMEEILQMLTSGKVNPSENADGAVVFSCVILITLLQEHQKLPCFNESQFCNLLHWLLEQYKCIENNVVDACRLIIAVGNVFALHPENTNKYFVLVWQMILKNISHDSSDVILSSTLQCLNKIMSALKDSKLSEEQLEACAEAGHKLLELHYDVVEPSVNHSNNSIIVLSTLEILQKIITLNTNFAKLRTAELLGLSKTYFHYGYNSHEMLLLKPQKVYMSQQALCDSAEEIETVINSEKARSCGGRTPKARKPRTVAKNARSTEYKTNNYSPETKSCNILFDVKTSDSDLSEPENASNRVSFERSRKAKIRMAAISLVWALVRILERKSIFGYWHALLPSRTGDADNLLFIGQRDPSLRCRAVALQVCALLLYGSRGYLHQAEINVKRCPATFIPFSVSLGYTVLAIYKTLTAIISSESSLPVLTQALKCMAVLVQASPFKQFEKGFVQDFVKIIKPLIYNRDAAVQVSALMIMEFLVAQHETTSDIAEAIGLEQGGTFKSKAIPHQHGDAGEMDIADIEEFVEFEKENLEDRNGEPSPKPAFSNLESSDKTSWLLVRILQNLSKQDKMAATSVRIESLQVLNVMSSNFAMIKSHLVEVSDVLLYNLNDTLSDVRLYAARCVDACAYQINRYLLDNSSRCETEVRECNKFWVNIMTFILTHIRRDSEEMTTVRIALCDALSNIGVLIFEYMPHCNQMNLLSFLSGVSGDGAEDALVRVVAARALSVFSLFPSLRGDLVFIENAAELMLRLVNDPNLLVRVKSFWSLGNLSDALIGNETELTQLRQEKISNDLLFRLITAATVACSDNDKVRCNAVRTLGNLLRLLNDDHLCNENSKLDWRQVFANAICKLCGCIRSSGNAKVKWNTCYAITNLMQNPSIFKITDLSWQGTLFSALCHVIVHHSNFKVRINASAAITNISDRNHFGVYYEKFWSCVLEAVEQSYNLDNFHEYNHRDSLQDQLCLALSHIITVGNNDDMTILKKHLMPRAEVIHNTWKRVINRMVPEKAAPLLSCTVVLMERAKHKECLSLEQKKNFDFLIEIFSAE